MQSLSRSPLRRITFFIAAAAIGLPVMAQSWQVPKPSPGLMPSASLGKTQFEKNCASCHGINLNGSKEGPPLLHPYYVPSHHGDPAFQLAVKNGVQAHHWKFGDMKPIPGLTPNDVAHITAYVRYRQRRVGIQ
ncbi:MAG: c-type cytochrome [Sulfuritalea sp.]|nr:c-type cytochrome [Sulfuritalea sp.]